MLIMMPDDVKGSELMMERLSKDNFLDILDSLAYTEVEVLLPQLAAFTNALDLEPFFRKLGVKTAFEPVMTAVAGRMSKSPAVTLVSMKQNAYFSMSFITINSVGSVGAKLGQYNERLSAQTAIFGTNDLQQYYLEEKGIFSLTYENFL